MSKYETEMVINVAGEESVIELTVLYDYLPAERGKWQDGLQTEPDYPAGIDVWEVYGKYENERLYIFNWLSKAQIRQLESDILDTYED